MRLNTNVIAMTAYRNYNNAFLRMQKSVERLSTGLRINRAADDPAGLAISEKMRAQIRGLKMASKNSQDAISLVATAEGALQETRNILQRMRELAIQSASDTNETSIDRAALNAEFQQLLKEIDDTAKRTVFNDQPLLDGTYGTTSDGIFSGVDEDIYARFYADTDMKNGNYTLSVDGSGVFTIRSQDGSHTATSKAVDFSKPYDKTNPIVLSFSDGSTMSFKLERDAEITNMTDLQALVFGGAGNDSVAFQHTNRGMTIQTGPN